MSAPRIVPTGVLGGQKGDKGDRGVVGPSGGPFPDLTGVTSGKVPQTTGGGGVEFVDLSASFVRPRTNTLGLIGNSLDRLCGLDPSTVDPAPGTATESVGARGWFTHANGLSGNRLTLLINNAVSGSRVDEYLAQVAAVTAAGPDLFSLGDAINSIAQDKTTAQITAAYDALLDVLAGQQVIIRTTTPAASVLTTTVRKRTLSEVNDWVRRLPLTRPGVSVVDAWSAIADRSASAAAVGMTIYGADSGAQTDDLHWSVQGAFKVGQLYADTLAPLLAPMPLRGSWDGDPKSVIASPSFTSGVSKQDSGNKVTLDVSQSDGKGGKRLRFTLAGATNNDERGAVIVQDIDSLINGVPPFAPNDVVQVTFNAAVSALTPLATATYCGLQTAIRQRVEGGGFAADVSFPAASSNQMVVPVGVPTAYNYAFTTPRVTIIQHTPRINLLYLYLEFIGASDVVVDITDLAIVKVS